MKKAKSQQFADELGCEDGRRRVFHIAKQLARDGQDVMNVNCLTDKSGKVAVDLRFWMLRERGGGMRRWQRQ